ncbi:hypothetical protein BVI434_210019 [Burkholderia vietnamiensis]|nr:hypothetical protein BVI434_210019 [Burkholderia vietnamiensis]
MPGRHGPGSRRNRLRADTSTRRPTRCIRWSRTRFGNASSDPLLRQPWLRLPGFGASPGPRLSPQETVQSNQAHTLLSVSSVEPTEATLRSGTGHRDIGGFSTRHVRMAYLDGVLASPPNMNCVRLRTRPKIQNGMTEECGGRQWIRLSLF